MRLAPAFMVVVACLLGLTACDPGYEFTVHNPCEAPMTVDFRDSNEFGERGTDSVTVGPHSTTEWTALDPNVDPPFERLLSLTDEPSDDRLEIVGGAEFRGTYECLDAPAGEIGHASSRSDRAPQGKVLAHLLRTYQAS